MHTEGDKKFCPAEAQENVSEPQQEIYPSFYVDRVLESGNVRSRHAGSGVMDLTRRAQELDRIEDLMYRISRGIVQDFPEFQMEDLFDELFYQIKRAKDSTRSLDRLRGMEERAYHLFQNYKNMMF